MNERTVYISQPVTGEDELKAIWEPLSSGWLTQGPKVIEFEKRFAELHGVPHSLATTSCTTALHLILAAMGIGPGDEVIVPAFTWVATANVVVYCGATPVLADVDARTFNLDPASVKTLVNSRTKAIIAVHLFGLSADIESIKEAAPGVAIIEDAACAIGSVYKGRFVGSLGSAAAFSFHPRKTVTTGEGGMVTTNNSDLFSKMETLRNHGASVSEEVRHHGPQPYLLPEFNVLGFNYRMTDIQGAMGLAQLSKMDKFISDRRKWASVYQNEIRDIKWLSTPFVPDDSVHSFQSYVCTVDSETAPRSRNEIMKILFSKGIHVRPGTHAVHTLGYYQAKFGYKNKDLPNAWKCDQQTMAIPLHNRMVEEDFEYVIHALKSIG